MKPESVFEKYAHEYDLITNAVAREKPHAKEVAAVIEKCNPTRVLDAGCAIGLSSYLFARQGVTAVGLDCSRAMITEARKKYGHRNLPLEFKQGRFERLPKSMTGRFDLVVCLANSISGVTNRADLKQSLANFARILKAGGYLVLQALNYDAIKEGVLFPIKATQKGNTGYIRYARRTGRQMEISIVRLDLSDRPLKFEPFTHSFDSYAPDLLASTMERVGFAKPKRYGNLLLTAPFRKSGRDVVLIARRP